MAVSLDTTISELGSVIDAFRQQAGAVENAGECILQALMKGHKILTCGNGGSAADALHLAEELVGRYCSDRRSLPGLSLNADVTALTCIANDFGYDAVFSRQIEGLGQPGDVLVGFTTSGNSPNIIRAFKTAGKLGIKTILLSGESGGQCIAVADHAILVPSKNGARIQEVHTLVLHHWLEHIEAQHWPSE